MGKIKGPLKIAFDNIQIEKDDYRYMIRIKRFQIHDLVNDYGRPPLDIAREMYQHHKMINWCKDQLKILEEKEKIISSA